MVIRAVPSGRTAENRFTNKYCRAIRHFSFLRGASNTADCCQRALPARLPNRSLPFRFAIAFVKRQDSIRPACHLHPLEVKIPQRASKPCWGRTRKCLRNNGFLCNPHFHSGCRENPCPHWPLRCSPVMV